MVKNKIGGNKSKNISSKVTKKKISAEEPDFENSFFARVTQKPHGLICKVKIMQNNQAIKDLVEREGVDGEVQVNIGKLKKDKRNNMLAAGDIVQVEFSFDMKRQNGEQFGTILCKYDNTELTEFKRAGKLKIEVVDDEEDIDLESELSPKEDITLVSLKEDITLDDL